MTDIDRMWIAAYDTDQTGKMYAYIIPISSENNLVSILAQHKDLEACNICKTKKKASQIAQMWNKEFETNGTYMFSNASF